MLVSAAAMPVVTFDLAEPLGRPAEIMSAFADPASRPRGIKERRLIGSSTSHVKQDVPDELLGFDPILLPRSRSHRFTKSLFGFLYPPCLGRILIRGDAPSGLCGIHQRIKG